LIYAITKMDQELMCLTMGEAYGIPTMALRYFNVYRPRRSLSNPYTGVAAIFSSRLLHGRPPVIFEDGSQSRHFIHVADVARANVLALESDRANGAFFNVGTGRPNPIACVARILANELGVDLEPILPSRYRAGDIRHCYADVSKARQRLGFEPRVAFANEMAELVTWVREQHAVDGVEAACAELERRGLAR
jgi:dTDP-L-rhamnose 4-epimerase